MANNIIKIPDVSRDERIGSVFNDLFTVIAQSEQYYGDEIIWDFSDCAFLHPFYIASLAIYRQQCERNIRCIFPKRISSYFELIRFSDTMLIEADADMRSVFDGYVNKSYTPVTKFNLGGCDVNALQSVFQNIIEKQSKAMSSLKTPLSYFLSELVCNMQQHSCSDYGYLFSQYLPREQCIDVCIADQGITIYGSYVRTNKYLDRILAGEAESLRMAVEGFSTKNLPDAENRGYGISTTKNMLVDGLKGGFFLLSGCAFHRHDINGMRYVNLPPELGWNGTIILLRIPINVDKNFNYINYLTNM